jgi:hypothetical protein
MSKLVTTPPFKLVHKNALNELGIKTDRGLSDFTNGVKIVRTIKEEIPPEWLSEICLWPDIFSYSGIGYWAKGIDHDNQLGHLIWLFTEDKREGNGPHLHDDAVRSWRKCLPLPEHYHVLNRALAVRAWVIMSKLEGDKWHESADVEVTDNAIQLALFGEVLYG